MTPIRNVCFVVSLLFISIVNGATLRVLDEQNWDVEL